MASYVTPKKNTAFVFYLGLVSQADTKLLQTNPTLAAGDVKVAIDDGAPANLATLPVVDAEFTKRVKVSLSAAEMNGDNISVLFSDAAGAEWCEQLVNIQTSARQIDDLAYPATSGRSMVVDVNGLVDATMVKSGPTGAGTAQTARDLGGQLDAAVSTRSTQASVDALPTAGANADAVWDEALAGHAVAGSAGAALSAAGSAGDPWSTALPGAYGAGTAGKIVGDNVNATISSRATAAALTTLQTDVTTLLSRITASLFSGITSIAQWLGLLAGKQTGNATARTELRATGAGAGTFDETTDSVEAIRDNMGTAQTGDSFARLGAPAGASIAADIATKQATLTSSDREAMADALLARHQKGGSAGGAGTKVSDALAGGLMRLSISGGVLTVLNGDGTTAYTRTLTRESLDAIITSVP
jgi:hypothetical protein